MDANLKGHLPRGRFQVRRYSNSWTVLCTSGIVSVKCVRGQVLTYVAVEMTEVTLVWKTTAEGTMHEL